MGESAKRFPTREAIQTNKRERDELRGRVGTQQTKTEPRSIGHCSGQTDASWESGLRRKEGVVGGRQKTKEGEAPSETLSKRRCQEKKKKCVTVTPCSLKDWILVYAYSSL